MTVFPELYWHISIDESGYLWLVNPDSMLRYDFRNNKFDKYEFLIMPDHPSKILSDSFA